MKVCFLGVVGAMVGAALGCGSPPASGAPPASGVAALAGSATPAPETPPPTRQEALAARVEGLKQTILAEWPDTKSIEVLGKGEDELRLVVVTPGHPSLQGERAVWVVSAQASARWPTITENPLPLVRPPGEPFALLESRASTLGFVRVGPAGELTAVLVKPNACRSSRLELARTLCGAELLCPSGATGERTGEGPTLGLSPCSERRMQLESTLRRAVEERYTRALQPFAPIAARSPGCPRPTEEELDRLRTQVSVRARPMILGLLRRELPSEPAQTWAPSLADLGLVMVPGCQDGKGSFVLHASVTLMESRSYSGTWLVRGRVAREVESIAGTDVEQPVKDLGDLDGDGASELATLFGSPYHDASCRLYSLTLPRRELPLAFCTDAAQPLTLPDRAVFLLDEEIFGLEKGRFVALKGPGSQDPIRQALATRKANQLAARSFVASLLEVPAGWEQNAQACTNPVRAAWAKKSRDALISLGLPPPDSARTVLLLASLDACPPPGLEAP